MKLYKIVFVSLIFCFSSNNIKADDESPGEIVKQTVEKVLTVLKDDSLDEANKKTIISKLAKERINFKDMSRRILATNWNKATDEQKTKFIGLFQEILLNTYWIRMSQYAGERVEYVAEIRDNEDYATVDTLIVKNDKVEVPISYRMKRFVSVWFAYDFTVEFLSLVQSYRNEYRATIKNHGIDGLLDLMQQEVDSYDDA